MKYPISLDESKWNGNDGVLKTNGNHYPKLRMHWDEKYDLPENGVMTVRFYKCEEVNTEREGRVSQSVELDILTIESVKADKESPKRSARDEAAEALDSYAAETEED